MAKLMLSVQPAKKSATYFFFAVKERFVEVLDSISIFAVYLERVNTIRRFLRLSIDTISDGFKRKPIPWQSHRQSSLEVQM